MNASLFAEPPFMKFSLTLLFLLFLVSCAPITINDQRPNVFPGRVLSSEIMPSKNGKVLQTPEDALRAMTLDEKIGQLFFISANGDFLNRYDSRFQHLRMMIQDYHVGGLIFFRGDVYGQALLTNELQRLSTYPLWITQDMEFGAAMRVRGTTRITPAMGVAATGNPEFAYQKGRITALEARALGVHQVFAPVVDVNNNPANPVINVRSFSEDPEIVSRFASAFIEGVQGQGVLATAKHFPGHGDTNIDSHFSLPTITHDYARLDTVELVPFRAAINSGVQSIMSAHIAFPEVSSVPGKPGTLDYRILNGILRDSLRFDGIIVTDALEMEGIASYYSPGDAAIYAILAGADMLLISPDELTAIDAIKRAVQHGRISEERINHSVRKILQLKYEKGLFFDRFVNLDDLHEKINTREHQFISDEIARSSITLLRNQGGIIPIRPHRHPKVTVLSLAEDQSGSTGSTFARAVRDYHPDVTFHVHDRRTSDADEERFLASMQNSDLVILASHITVRMGSNLQLNNRQRSFIDRVNSLGKPMAVIAFGNPYILSDLPNADVHVAAWSSVANQVQATASALFGASDIDARLPIGIPGIYRIGDGISIEKTILREDVPEAGGLHSDSLRRVDRIITQAIKDSVFPGAQLAVVRNGILAYHQVYGYHDYTKRVPVKTTDMYDVASITKIAATTLAAMKLVEENRLSLDDRVSRYFPEFRRGNKTEVTIRHLLTHTSGLPAFRVYVDEIQNREQLLGAIKNEPLIHPPGTEYVYSDLGFILLGEIIQAITGESLDRYLTRNFYYPMGMQWTVFNPHRRGRAFVNRIPPTEIDNTFRNKEMKGEVHDERAYYLGGVAGHAGLFSTAHNLAIFAELMLQKGTYGGRRYLSEEIVNQFIALQPEPGNRALGFDLRSPSGFTTAGQFTSERTFGHLGFTGTSIWIDPEYNLAIILLTNRTYPNRSYGSAISRVRSMVSDEIMQSIIK